LAEPPPIPTGDAFIRSYFSEDLVSSETKQPPPPFDPDPELIDHLEGNAHSLRGYRRKAKELRRAAQSPSRSIFEMGKGVPILPPNAYRTHLPLPPEPVSVPIRLDPSTVRAIAVQVQELLEATVRENPDHPWL
jgi:hypothetical protein